MKWKQNHKCTEKSKLLFFSHPLFILHVSNKKLLRCWCACACDCCGRTSNYLGKFGAGYHYINGGPPCERSADKGGRSDGRACPLPVGRGGRSDARACPLAFRMSGRSDGRASPLPVGGRTPLGRTCLLPVGEGVSDEKPSLVPVGRCRSNGRPCSVLVASRYEDEVGVSLCPSPNKFKG